MSRQNQEKKLAGEEAVHYVKDGMVLGLGTGSTVFFTIKKLAEVIQANGWTVSAVSTSSSTTELAKSLGIAIMDLNDVTSIDLTIDGADEVDDALQGIKGGGGALLFEKLVATTSKKNIWVIDSSKKVDKLGAFPLPVEVIPYGHIHTVRKMEEQGLFPKIRMNGETPYYTDSNHLIVDLYLQRIEDAPLLNSWLNNLPGVVETGLFLNVVDTVIIASGNKIKTLQR